MKQTSPLRTQSVEMKRYEPSKHTESTAMAPDGLIASIIANDNIGLTSRPWSAEVDGIGTQILVREQG